MIVRSEPSPSSAAGFHSLCLCSSNLRRKTLLASQGLRPFEPPVIVVDGCRSPKQRLAIAKRRQEAPRRFFQADDRDANGTAQRFHPHKGMSTCHANAK